MSILKAVFPLQIIRGVGSWTVSRRGGQWSESTWSVENALHTANLYQVWPLFDRDVRQDLYDSRHMIITVSAFTYCLKLVLHLIITYIGNISSTGGDPGPFTL